MKEFIKAFTELQNAAHKMAKDKGFWDHNPSAAEKIALMHSELSEALENNRHGCKPDDKIPEFSGEEAEFADCMIRMMDYAGSKNLRLAEAMIAKMAFNSGRPYKHGKEY